METELTKKMKKGVIWHKPALTTKMRILRFATEVWTPSGIVDAIRFEDYKEKDYSFCSVIDYQKFDKSYQETWQKMHPTKKLGECKIKGETYPNKNCEGCFWHSRSYDIGMLITCYECKITLSDFKSQNGHNFHGNKNYYVVPKELVNKIEQLVPKEIGIIAYYPDTDRFRTVKEAEFKEVSEEVKTKLLYNALGKWCSRKEHF